MNLRKQFKAALKLAAMLGVFVATSVSLQAGAIIYEGFDYDTDPEVIENLNGKDGGAGFSGAWASSQRNGLVQTGSLTWGNLATSGDARASSQAWSAPFRPLGTELADAGLMADGSTLWFSFVMDCYGQNLSNMDFCVALTTDPFTNVYGNKQNLKNDGTGIGVANYRQTIKGGYWEDDGDGGGESDGYGELHPVDTTLVMNNGVALPEGVDDMSRALVVGKIEWGVAGETLTLYAPGTDLALSTPILDPWTTSALDQSQFDTLAIQWKDSQMSVDEIRFGATYGDVVMAVPEPASMVLMLFGALGLMGLRRRK